MSHILKILKHATYDLQRFILTSLDNFNIYLLAHAEPFKQIKSGWSYKNKIKSEFCFPEERALD
jgi:hypothetical protein